jgi:ADP-ribose pyrophosphatase YjhB (NUDIX family)
MKEYYYCPICGSRLKKQIIEGKQRKYCHNCGFVHYENPLPVALAIAIRDRKFLMVKRGIEPKKGGWAPPSGFIESGETSEEACLREMAEETGLSGKIKKLVEVKRVEDEEMYGDMLVVVYLVEEEGGSSVAGDEVEQVKFFEIDQLPDYYVNRFKETIEDIRNEWKKGGDGHD